MATEAQEQFARALMAHVRDTTICDWKRLLAGRLKGPTAKKLSPHLSQFSLEQTNAIAEHLVPEITDTCLHHLLALLDGYESIQIKVDDDSEASEIIDTSSEMQMSLYGEEGWIVRFSEHIKR